MTRFSQLLTRIVNVYLTSPLDVSEALSFPRSQADSSMSFPCLLKIKVTFAVSIYWKRFYLPLSCSTQDMESTSTLAFS